MNILITKSQYVNLKENLDQVLDLYSKMNSGKELKPSEKDVLRAFKRFTDKGGNPEDFIFDLDYIYDNDERQGMKFKYNIKGKPFIYEFSEEIDKDDEIEYYGEVKYNDDEFLGVIVTDKRGYLITYDFYSVISDQDIRLQNILKNEGTDSEIQHFFQEEVINSLKK
jgi:hypothetical protein